LNCSAMQCIAMHRSENIIFNKNPPYTCCMMLTKLIPTSFLFGNAYFDKIANHKKWHYKSKNHLTPTTIVLFNSGRLGFLFCLYHLILANKNWSQIEQLWSVLIRTLYIIRQKTKTRSKYVLIGHDLLQF